VKSPLFQVEWAEAEQLLLWDEPTLHLVKPQELQAGDALLVSAPNLLRSVELLAGRGFLLRDECENDALGDGWVMQGWAAGRQEGEAGELCQSQDVAAALPPWHDCLPL